MKLLPLLLLASVAIAHRPSVFLIRHAEKPRDKQDHHLSETGKQRAQCLRNVFSEDSHYDIGKIMVEKPRKKGTRMRPFDTVAPLAKDLGIEIDDSCGQMDAECVKRAIKQYRGRGNVLVCWEHKGLGRIIRELGVRGKHRYPTKSYNLIWSIHHPYSALASVASENCPGLDHGSSRDRARPKHEEEEEEDGFEGLLEHDQREMARDLHEQAEL